MEELLHFTDFESLLHTEVNIQFTPETILPARLVSLSLYDNNSPVDRKPFSLIFLTDQKSEYFPQAISILQHPQKGEIAIFLVPLGFDGEGMRYEAVFS